MASDPSVRYRKPHFRLNHVSWCMAAQFSKNRIELCGLNYLIVLDNEISLGYPSLCLSMFQCKIYSCNITFYALAGSPCVIHNDYKYVPWIMHAFCSKIEQTISCKFPLRKAISYASSLTHAYWCCCEYRDCLSLWIGSLIVAMLVYEYTEYGLVYRDRLIIQPKL